MNFAINSEEVPIHYLAKFREYGVQVLDGGTSNIVFLYCPWCGQILPASLRDRWFNTLETLGLEPTSSELPVKFRTAEWWTLDR